MAKLFPALNFLYLQDSSLDLYLKTLKEAIQSIPRDVLQVEYNCFPIITDYSGLSEAENSGISLGYGFHYSDFEAFSSPKEGLVFCLNPPYNDSVDSIKFYNTPHRNEIIPFNSSFMVGEYRFLLTGKEFNLDEVVCNELITSEIYKKSETS